MNKINWFLVGAILSVLIGAFLGLNCPDKFKGYDLIEPEKGVKCAKIIGIYNVSISCWKEGE